MAAARSCTTRDSHTAVWDPINSQMIVFGGIQGCGCGALNDLWFYKPSTNAWTQPAAREMGRLSGFNHYLTKPYSAQDLRALLAALPSTR